tara:strand:+ start:11884 stop:12021 length:138 start_codon:yes stop_codon:yes gene_type:complete
VVADLVVVVAVKKGPQKIIHSRVQRKAHAKARVDGLKTTEGRGNQ